MYSYYHGECEVKFMVACSPGGANILISDGYGGRATDDMITHHSGIALLLAHQDADISMDRGFTCEEALAEHGIGVQRPAQGRTDFSIAPQSHGWLIDLARPASPHRPPNKQKGVRQFGIHAAEESQRVANTRIYSEHAVRSIKEWRQVGQSTLPLLSLDIAHAVAACAFYLSNFTRVPYVSRKSRSVRRETEGGLPGGV